ncbi:DUF3857 domain-containing protein [Flavihumibacter sp. R14]|nr:DUF3857 domain-containing protein [Flavihumibacter soli]
MFKHLLFFLLISASTLTLRAQVAEKAPADPNIKYGKIELSEFQIKPQGKDSAASAIKIFDKGDLKFEINNKTSDFRYVFTRHTRILILKKDAYDLADIEIGLYKRDTENEEILSGFSAATYNLDKGAISSAKLTKEAKFLDKFDKNITIKKFTLSNIQEGSIIEYKYEIRSDFLFTLRDWAFQGSIPTMYSDFTITIPEYFNYKKNIHGYVPVSVAASKTISQNFTGNLTGEAYSSDRSTITCQSTVQRYTARDVPALKDEAFITTLDDYRSKLELEIHSTKFPNSPYRSYTDTWEKIVSELDNDQNFGSLLRSNYGKTLASDIVGTETDPLKKLNKIFTFVKQNMKHNGEDNKYSQQTSLRQIIDKKTGNVADINLLLINLLDHAGLNSSPILLSTRSNGAHPGNPLISKFNYVIAGVTIDSNKYFLDATNPINGLNMLEFDCLNHKGLALDMKLKTAEWIPLELKNISQNALTYRLKLSPENVFKGMVYERKTEFNGLSTRQKYKESANEEEYLKSYKEDRNGLKIENFKISNIDSLSSPITMEYTATVEDMVEEAGNLVYFTPLLYERTKENPFKLEERNFPVDFGFANEETYRIIIELPESMTVDKLPKSEMIRLEDNSAFFSYVSASDGKSISIVSKINIGKSYYDPESYFELKELFKKIVSKQAEQIVLKKI